MSTFRKLYLFTTHVHSTNSIPFYPCYELLHKSIADWFTNADVGKPPQQHAGPPKRHKIIPPSSVRSAFSSSVLSFSTNLLFSKSNTNSNPYGSVVVRAVCKQTSYWVHLCSPVTSHRRNPRRSYFINASFTHLFIFPKRSSLRYALIK